MNKNKKLKNGINVIGLGYTGLPTALMLAASGYKVTGTDCQEQLVSQLSSGKLPFDEKGMAELFDKALSQQILFSREYQATNFYIIAVPTPYVKATKKVDPFYLIQALKETLSVCLKGAIIVFESTIPPGTIDTYIRPLVVEAGLVVGEDIHLAHAPERILPGNMIEELKQNARTIGADNSDIAQRIKVVYQSFCYGEIEVKSIRTAEMTKVVENTYRDINIAFANELAQICSDELDVYDVIRIANKHPRVNILKPGPGVGGHCISVDPWFLVGAFPGQTPLIRTARLVNEKMPDHVLLKIKAIMAENKLVDDSRIGLYGLSYKENVNDVRESPTLQLQSLLKKKGGPMLKTYDPMVNQVITTQQVMDFDEFLAEVDVVVIMVAHQHLKDNLWKLKNKIILDTQYVVEDAYFL